MFRRIGLGLVVVAAGALGLSKFAPGLWTHVDRKLAQVAGWTEDARQNDPEGFLNHVEQKLRGDREAMEQSRRELAAETGRLAEVLREQEALQADAQRLAQEFRDQYQEAAAEDGFPIEVRGAAYTEAQAKAQVSLLLAQAQGFAENLAKLRKAKDDAESQIQTYVVKLEATEAQLAMLPAQRELLRARRLSSAGEQLLAQLDELFDENARVIQGNPVRSVQELLAASPDGGKKPASEEAVAAFLAEQRPTPPVATVPASPRPSKSKTKKPGQPNTPIFQQS
jgi:hypothetical protein